MIGRIRKEFAFARLIPKRRIARRLVLAGQRRLDRKFRPSLATPGMQDAPDPPLALMPMRAAMLARTASGWRFDALGHTHHFNADIDWRVSGPSGRDQLWRMTLHYMEYLEPLADAEFAEVVDSWIEANPPFETGSAGDAWNAYAISLRAVVWMQQLANRRARLDPDFVVRANRSLTTQLRYLERYLETDIGGNHLIKNIKALMWGSAYFDGEIAHAWRTLGERMLDSEMNEQMLPDGMHFERSASYHCQVFVDLLEIRHANGPNLLGGEVDATLQRAAQVIADLAHPDGFVAQFSDSGLHMAYAPDACLDAFASIFGYRPSGSPSFSYPDAGYYGVRGPAGYAVMDAGPIAPDSLPAHGHGDMLSLEWSLGQQRIIVDQGVFEYLAGDRRDVSRSAASHNTLSFPGRDQAEFYGAFRSAGRAAIVDRTIEMDAEKIVVTAAHNGYLRGNTPSSKASIHRRSAQLSADCLLVEDHLDGPATIDAVVNFLIHPQVVAMQHGSGQVRLDGDKGSVLVTSSHRLRIEPAVWWPDIGFEYAAQRINFILPAGETSAWTEFKIMDE